MRERALLTPRGVRGGGAPGSRAEILLHPMVMIIGKQGVLLQPVRYHTRADSPLQPMEDLHAGAGSCKEMWSVKSCLAYTGTGFVAAPVAHGGPVLEQFMNNSVLLEGPHSMKKNQWQKHHITD